jgi:hypothetical protein
MPGPIGAAALPRPACRQPGLVCVATQIGGLRGWPLRNGRARLNRGVHPARDRKQLKIDSRLNALTWTPFLARGRPPVVRSREGCPPGLATSGVKAKLRDDEMGTGLDAGGQFETSFNNLSDQH